jgi:hypothetical protein
MDNQEKIQNKKCFPKAEEKNFPAMEKFGCVKKNSMKKKTKKLLYFGKISHCRSPIVFSLGYQFIKTDSSNHSSGTKENSVVIQEKTQPKQTEGLSKP